jgi:hypothetical protein
MSNKHKDPDKVDPKPDEGKLEDLPAEWAKEDREEEGRKPDLGELEEDPSED